MVNTVLWNAVDNDYKLEQFYDWQEKNYDDLRYNYKEWLKEADSYHGDLDEVDDGWMEFCQEYYREEFGNLLTPYLPRW